MAGRDGKRPSKRFTTRRRPATMIVLDSSILVGIIKGEKDTDPLLDLLAGEACVIGAPTLVETRAWCAMNLSLAPRGGWRPSWTPTTPRSYLLAATWRTRRQRAFAKFGRGRSGHPAKLNFGDCMA